MTDTNKKEYTSNLHPKGDMDTTVYPNVKSENIIDKDTTAYTAGKVPDSSLVSKSLDSLNEKVETNKIQTDTNKTNIAKNTKDIANLKANYTQVQSQANTNSSDIALLESNAIKKDTDASLKSLTLPSASDLKTKDGTSFGGGSKVYNGTEYLPTFDIATLKDTYVDINSDQTIYGDKKFMNNLSGDSYFKIGYNPWGPGYAYSPGIGLKGRNDSLITFTNSSRSLNDNLIISGNPGFIGLGYGFFFKTTYETTDYNIVEFNVPLNNTISFKFNSAIIKMNPKNLNAGMALSKDSGATWTEYALTSDLATKQSTIYRHTVLISESTNKTAYLSFTAESVNNTPIDSIQKLITVFGNTSISCSGLFRDGDPANSQSLLMINVGTSISNTTISSATIENNAITDFSNALFTDTFGSAGFTITDNVTPM